MKRLLLVCSVVLLLCGSAGAGEGNVWVNDVIILPATKPCPDRLLSPQDKEDILRIVEEYLRGREKKGTLDESMVDWQTRQKIEEYKYQEWIKHYKRWLKENESEWILVLPEQYLKLMDKSVPKNYHDWHLEGMR